jgi:FAD/FMN-containing dehydrogenase
MANPRAFLDAVGKDFPEDRFTYQKRLVTFHPETTEEAARFIKAAGTEKQPVYITGFGNNIDPIGEPFENLVVLRTDRLNDILEVSQSDLYVKVGAGFPLREINLELKDHNLFMPHAALPYVGSAGGAVAVNLSAEMHGHEVPIKKYFIRAEVVTPEGEIIEPGSVCFKSVSGYDIVKIYAASWGLLGLIFSVTFRVVPDTAVGDFAAMKMKAVDRTGFLQGLEESNVEADAVYSRKIKARFDPHGVLPVV